MRQLAQLIPAVALVVLAACAGSGGGAPAVTAPAVAPAAAAAQSPAPTPVESPPQAATPDPGEPLSNRLKWSTASEVDNFGFDIYRSTSEEGPFDRLTAQPIPGAGTVDEPRYYEYVDTAIEAGTDYFYYVESISVDGIREKFSPIIRAPAKGPKQGEGASEEAP